MTYATMSLEQRLARLKAEPGEEVERTSLIKHYLMYVGSRQIARPILQIVAMILACEGCSRFNTYKTTCLIFGILSIAVGLLCIFYFWELKVVMN